MANNREIRYTRIENPVIYVPIRHLYNCRESSTNQAYFLQNKANLLAVSKIPKMNITSATTVNYINELRTTNYELIMENKANSKPNKANCRKGKIDAMCVFTKEYEGKCG